MSSPFSRFPHPSAPRITAAILAEVGAWSISYACIIFTLTAFIAEYFVCHRHILKYYFSTLFVNCTTRGGIAWQALSSLVQNDPNIATVANNIAYMERNLENLEASYDRLRVEYEQSVNDKVKGCDAKAKEAEIQREQALLKRKEDLGAVTRDH